MEPIRSTRSTLTHRLMTIYLQDHYAGATAGVALARRSGSSLSGTTVHSDISQVAREIEEDRAALRTIMGSLRVRPARSKALLAWVGEKAGRLKGNGRLIKRSPLSDVVELEALIIAVSGKARLWECLLQVAGGDVRLQESDVQTLAKRAEDQRARLEQLHREYARSTFG
jgi:hypothetical protein